MRTPRRRRLTTAVTASAVLFAAGTTAAVGGTVPVEVTIEADSSALFLTHATDTVTLTASGSNPAFDAADPTTVTGALPSTTVTDNRGGLLNSFAVGVTGTALTHTGDGSHTIAPGQIHVFLDAANLPALVTLLTSSLTGTTVITGGEFTVGTNRLSATPYNLLTGTTALGGGSATFVPQVRAVIPAGSPAGTYTGTITMTAS